MTSSPWRKRLSILWSRLYLYPPPEPLPWTRTFWIASGLVALAALLFSAYFIVYLTTRHAAFLTNAEDLGIMDQAIWNTLHGHVLHQTICNIVSDTNCYSLNGISRFAIHFEPILFPVSLFYLIWPDPRMLLIIQTLVVATGAFPAFWLARLRLRNEWVAVGIALLYLFYPAQQYALTNDFHAVTFTAAFLLFLFYFMYTRRTVWMFVFAILAMACKEEIPVLVALYALWSMLFQRRWRTGLGLVALALAWVGVELLVERSAGGPLLASRYAYLGHGPVEVAKYILLHPVEIIKQHVLEHNHLFYLRLLLSPAGYLPLLAPWVLVLALPTLALNLLSSKPDMYSGLYHYDVEMVPVLVFATIEALVLIVWVCQRLLRRFWEQRTEVEAAPQSAPAPEQRRTKTLRYWTQLGLLTVLGAYVLLSAVRGDIAHGSLPFSQGFQWPQTTAHTELAQRFIDMIPADASVSTQSALAAHLSQRERIYLFPYADEQADYILLDATGNMYPLFNGSYTQEVKKVLLGGKYGIEAAQDGYLLLKRGLPPPGISPRSPVQSGKDVLPNLPASFCSFENATQQEVEHPLRAAFTQRSGTAPLLDLIGYHLQAPQVIDGGSYMQVTTYWKVQAQTLPALQILVLLRDQRGGTHLLTTDFPGFNLCPTITWKAGQIVRLQSVFFSIQNLHVASGVAHMSIALVPLNTSGSTMVDVQTRLPVQLLNATTRDVTVPAGTNAVDIASMTVR